METIKKHSFSPSTKHVGAIIVLIGAWCCFFSALSNPPEAMWKLGFIYTSVLFTGITVPIYLLAAGFSVAGFEGTIQKIAQSPNIFRLFVTGATIGLCSSQFLIPGENIAGESGASYILCFMRTALFFGALLIFINKLRSPETNKDTSKRYATGFLIVASLLLPVYSSDWILSSTGSNRNSILPWYSLSSMLNASMAIGTLFYLSRFAKPTTHKKPDFSFVSSTLQVLSAVRLYFWLSGTIIGEYSLHTGTNPFIQFFRFSDITNLFAILCTAIIPLVALAFNNVRRNSKYIALVCTSIIAGNCTAIFLDLYAYVDISDILPLFSSAIGICLLCLGALLLIRIPIAHLWNIKNQFSV